MLSAIFPACAWFVRCRDVTFYKACDEKDEAEVSEKIRNLLGVVLILLFVAGVGVSPVVADSGGLPFLAVSRDAVAQVQFSSNLFKSLEFSDLRLIEIGKELSEPPVAITNSTKSSQFGVKPLPAVPATFFMVLAGFLCVSIIKDRKIWLKVVFGALYFGAVGVNVVPKLLADTVNIKIKQASSDKGTVRKLRNFVRPMYDAQGTRYIGLLHRMAIPDGDSFAENHGGGSLAAHWYDSDVLPVSFLRSAPSGLYSYLSAIIKSHTPQPSPRNLFAAVCSCLYPSRVSVPNNNSYFSLNYLTEARFF